MADPGNVVIKIIPDTSELESTLDQLQNSGSVSGADAKSFEAGNTALKTQNTLLAAQAKAYTDIETSQKKQLPTISSIEKATDKMASKVVLSAAQFQAGFKASGKSLQEFITGIGKYKVAAADTTKAVSGVLTAQGKYRAVLVDSTKETKNQADAVLSLRSKMRLLQEQIAQHLMDGDNMSDQYKKLVAEAGELRDAMGDAGEAIARAGSDTRAMDNVIDLAQGITAGFAIAQGAAALFGDENEELQKTLLKVNAAMSILNGIQAIQDLLRKEHIKTLLTTIRAQVVSNAQTAIDSGLKSRNIIVTKLATTAQWALNAAMAVSPLGWLAIGIGLVIGALSLFSNTAKTAAEAQEELNAAQQQGFELSERYYRVTKSNIDKLIDDTERQISLAKSQGKSTAQILALEQKLAELRVRAAGENKKHYSDQIANIDEYKTKIQDLLLDEMAANGEIETYTDRNNKKAAEEASKRRDAIRTNIDFLLNQIDLAQQAEKDYSDAVTKQQEKNLEQQRYFSEQALKNRKGYADAALAVSKQNSEEELNAKILVLKAQQAIELSNIELTAGERKAITARTEKEIADLKRDFAYKQINEQRELEVIKAQMSVEASRFAWGEYSDQALAAQTELLVKQSALDITRVQQSLASEERKAIEISLINQRLSLELDRLDSDRAKRQVEINQQQIDAFRELVMVRLQIAADNPFLDEDEKFKAQQEILTQELKNAEDRRADIHAKALVDREYADSQYMADLIRNQADIEKRTQALVQASEERKLQIRQKYTQMAFDQASQLANTFFQIEANRRQAEIDEKLYNLQLEYETQVNVKNLTEEQKAGIEKRYRAQEAQIKNQAAQKERNAQVAAAVVNGILSVTNALATVKPWWAALVAAGVATATAALNVASIRSQPLPRYAVGVKDSPEGPAVVGEHGSELIVGPDGRMYVSPATPTVVYLERGSQVVTAGKTKELLSQNIPSDNSSMLSDWHVDGSGTLSLDYDEMGKAMAKYMPKQPTMVMNADKHGFSMYLEQENTKTYILNQRYSN